jgi:hypothetical protein
VLALQVQTTRDQDNLSDQNLSPDHEPIVGWCLASLVVCIIRVYY